MNTGRRNLSKEMIQMLIALSPKSWSKPSTLIVILENYFGQYLDLSEDNNARFQMKMVYDLLKRRIAYPYTLLEIKAAKRRRKDTFKTLSIIKKSKIAMPLSLSCTDVQCARATEEQHELKKVDITATAKEHNMTVDNPSTASKDEEKVEPVSLGERKNYPFEGTSMSFFTSSERRPNAYYMYCQHQPEVFSNEECLINIIKGFSITTDLPWHLIDEVYIPINCGDEFHWVLVVVVLKERPSEFMTRYHEGDIPGHRLRYKSWPKYLP
ncbi:hypothetical protein FXO37_16790 [Capsicum annuum]|nr:hypothetical protein FXO37_16790 [Capsicum annuum]